MKKIFNLIMERKWDWFGYDKCQIGYFIDHKRLVLSGPHLPEYYWYVSLADLISNKSFCHAIWGNDWNFNSKTCFRILLEGDYNSCIEYIKSTAIEEER